MKFAEIRTREDLIKYSFYREVGCCHCKHIYIYKFSCIPNDALQQKLDQQELDTREYERKRDQQNQIRRQEYLARQQEQLQNDNEEDELSDEGDWEFEEDEVDYDNDWGDVNAVEDVQQINNESSSDDEDTDEYKLNTGIDKNDNLDELITKIVDCSHPYIPKFGGYIFQHHHGKGFDLGYVPYIRWYYSVCSKCDKINTHEMSYIPRNIDYNCSKCNKPVRCFYDDSSYENYVTYYKRPCKDFRFVNGTNTFTLSQHIENLQLDQYVHYTQFKGKCSECRKLPKLLQDQIRDHFIYRPGGEGYYEAKADFERLQSKINMG